MESVRSTLSSRLELDFPFAPRCEPLELQLQPAGQKKGLSFVAVRDYVRAEHGDAAWERVLSRLRIDEADTLRSVVGVGWYSLALYARLLRAADVVLGHGDLRAIRAIVRFEAERDLPTIHRLLLKLVNPAFVVEKMAELWPRYHSTGELRLERRGANAVEATLRGWATDEALCRGFQGYCERALEFGGAHDLVFAHARCRARGAPACVFLAGWGGVGDATPAR